MAGKFMRGALIELTPALIIPIPNIIVFQFNPETIRHTLTPAAPMTTAAGATPATGAPAANPNATPGLPAESFSLTLQMDAKEQIIEGSPVTSGLASATGIHSRIAALELLTFPAEEGGGLFGTVSISVSVGGAGGGASASGSAGGTTSTVPRRVVPTVLFVWGPGRILPVRIQSLSVTETLFDGLLNPTHAEAQVELKVLTEEDLRAITGLSGDIARATYTYTQVFRKAMATANLANAAESIIGMLPI